MEKRPCAHCERPFVVNPRARESHRFCRRVECQSVRRCRAQNARRAEHGCPKPSDASKRKRADYMVRYREQHAAYRRRDRDARRRRHAVTEAGSGVEQATVYVVRRPGDAIRLRVVTEAGSAIEFRADATSDVTQEILGRAVTEAG